MFGSILVINYFENYLLNYIFNGFYTQSEIYSRGNVENGWKSLIMVDHAWKYQ